MFIKLVDRLSQDITKLLNNKDYFDTIIEVEDGQIKKTFTAHST
ncbi:13273_t:CDS:1, partial [Acaulospora morrowiae]